MHIHILGICGTFMGGIAAIARESGHKVTGCDASVYPPMSTQLESQGIKLIEGYSPEQIKLQPDVYVIGNIITRGNPLMEEILNRNLPYTSGPQWLSENILRNKWVIAVTGTHGKTTTASMLAWILECADLRPGFLIGGIPNNFGVSARLGKITTPLAKQKDPNANTQTPSPFFVIEADEYDTAFFDKRSKFVHYHPKTIILNNLEFDHADIFPNLAAIERQFHHLIRIVPNNGLIVTNDKEASLKRVLAKGCWTPIESFGTPHGWHTKINAENDIDIYYEEKIKGNLRWDLLGEHNRMNAVAALGAARHAGVPITIGIEALMQFKNVKRRMEIRGIFNDITVYDDFAHHPTSIQMTLDGLRSKIGHAANIIAVLEPRSNSMKMGVWKDNLADSLAEADHIYCYAKDANWDINNTLRKLGSKVHCHDDLIQLIQSISSTAKPNDHILIMSNGSFNGIHEKLLNELSGKG